MCRGVEAAAPLHVERAGTRAVAIKDLVLDADSRVVAPFQQNRPGGVAEPAGATGGTPAGGATTLRNGVLNTIPTVGSALANRVGGDNEAPDSRQPGTRAPLPEVINDNPTQPGLAATVTVIITRP